MKTYEFKAAKAVWERGEETTVNRWLVFRAEIKRSADAVIALTGSCAYVVRVNGDFVAFGPARSAHGFYRVDELDLAPPS
jgi:alpha-L-rhamnosidase